MRHAAILVSLAALSLPLFAADEPDEAPLVAIQALGYANGEALACDHKTLAARVKSLMLAHAPKTRRFGEAFEQATNESFLQQSRDQGGCPKEPELAGKVDIVEQQLRDLLPLADNSTKSK